MKKKLNRIIELHCEDDSKVCIMNNINEQLVNNVDYKNGNILVNADRPDFVDVIIFEGCSDISELIKLLTF